MDAFLEEQLKRLREFTSRMSGFEKRSAELSEELERDRESMHRHPLCDVRDLRAVKPSSRSKSNDSPRRRRRRKRA